MLNALEQVNHVLVDTLCQHFESSKTIGFLSVSVTCNGYGENEMFTMPKSNFKIVSSCQIKKKN